MSIRMIGRIFFVFTMRELRERLEALFDNLREFLRDALQLRDLFDCGLLNGGYISEMRKESFFLFLPDARYLREF